MKKQVTANSLLDFDIIFNQARLDEGTRVADLGCGASGHFVFPFSKAVGAKGKVYAVDILPDALKNIKHRFKQESLQNIKTVWSNLEIFNACKIDSSSLDSVFLINTLYQSKKRVEIIKEAVRMLKKGAFMMIVDWGNISAPFGPSSKEKVLKQALKDGASRLGLEFKSEFSAGQYHYGLIFEKI
ncbi:MAG: class I SAM-dependent methyltransferase [Patescibacteria group bacterium]|nr:class I SAM-dependent methyltransferase [Patescibacteria group bacterium]